MNIQRYLALARSGRLDQVAQQDALQSGNVSGATRYAGGSIGEMRDAYAQAKYANVTRDQNIQAGYDERIGAIQGMNDQQAADIRSQFAGAMSGMMQGLTDRGMAGTTIAPTMRAGMKRRETADLRRNANNTLMMRLQAMMDKLGFMERRTDAYPDLNRFAALMQGAGRYA